MSAPPPITILMAVRDGVRTLPETLASIQAQSFADYELVAVEDFSSDATPELLHQAAKGDDRIRVIRNPRHQGLTRSLNIGLAQSRGRTIARIDADDLMEPQRLARQYARMQEEPGLVLLGSDVSYIDADGAALVKTDPCPPLTDPAIRWTLLFDNAFYHSSVLFVRHPPDWPNGVRYDEAFRFGQDFALWPRLLEHGAGANLEEPLTRCRLHGERISTPEVRQLRLQHCLEASAPRLRRYLPAADLPPQEQMALKQAWNDFPVAPVTAAGLRPYLILLRLFLAFEEHHGPAGLDRERTHLHDLLLSIVASHPGAAWTSGLIPTLLRRAPGAMTQSALRKLKGKLSL